MSIQFIQAPEEPPAAGPQILAALGQLFQNINQVKQQRFEKKMMDAILKSESPEELKGNIASIMAQREKKRSMLGKLGNAINPFGDYTGPLDMNTTLALKKLSEPEEPEKPLKGSLNYWKAQGLSDVEAAKAVRTDAGILDKEKDSEEPELSPAEMKKRQVKDYISQAEKNEKDIPGIEAAYGITGMDYDEIENRYINFRNEVGKFPVHVDPDRIAQSKDVNLARQYEGVKQAKARKKQAEMLRKRAKEIKKSIAIKEAGGQSQVPAKEEKELDAETARAILQEAGGDKEKARKIAKDRGYSF